MKHTIKLQYMAGLALQIQPTITGQRAEISVRVFSRQVSAVVLTREELDVLIFALTETSERLAAEAEAEAHKRAVHQANLVKTYQV